MDVPFHAATTARAAIVICGAGPRRLVELRLVDFPDATRARQKSERHRAADNQQLMRPDFWYATTPAWMTIESVERAAKARGREEPISPPWVIRRDAARRVAGRAVNIERKAVPTNVAYRLEWKRAEHGAKRNAAASLESLCQQ
jgi:hypothetical protein